MVAPGVVMKNLVTILDLGQFTVVFGEWLKYIPGQRYQSDLCGASVAA